MIITRFKRFCILFNRQSVDFVAATQDNLGQTPLIVPNSPTGQENEHGKIDKETGFIYKIQDV